MFYCPHRSRVSSASIPAPTGRYGHVRPQSQEHTHSVRCQYRRPYITFSHLPLSGLHQSQAIPAEVQTMP